ncbi:hypothetical protein [Sinorhizobium fredii]|uniref:hypothetical protein n=1 Tax=Rhizobium fredii TaxID=380 RepID=UPI0004B6927C|nr:hypothetical protein [Sinorhizobium fredii]ASY68867.1 hypothetical protein SF83666_c14460 [Sinorhizobium fredii CCBAU 83666]
MNDAEQGRLVDSDTEGGLFFQPVAGVGADPLIGAITSFKRQMALFNRLALIGDEDVGALADRTYRPPLAMISAWRRPAISREGALAALKLAEEGCRDNDPAITGPMLRAAIGYFEKDL